MFSSITLDDVLLEFDYELKYTDDEHTDYDFVCNVLSSGMVLAWIEPQVKSMNNIHQYARNMNNRRGCTKMNFRYKYIAKN